MAMLPSHERPSFLTDFGNIWRAADKVVYSKTLKAASTPRTRIERNFQPEAVRWLKASAARQLFPSRSMLPHRSMNNLQVRASAEQRVVDKQNNDRANNGDQDAVKI